MRRILIILILAVMASGCAGDESGGGGEGGDGTTPSPESASTTPTPSVDPGCTPNQPRQQQDLGQQYAVLVDVCQAEDGTSLMLRNVSSAVLQVWSLGQTEPAFFVEPSDDKSLSATAIQTVVANSTPPIGRVLVAPGARVVARGNGPLTLDLAIDKAVTASAFGAGWLAAWVHSRLQSQDQRLLGNISTCAKYLATTYQPNTAVTWEQALGNAIAQFIPSCYTFVSQLSKAEHAPPKEATIVAHDVAQVGRTLRSETLEQALKFFGRFFKVAAEAR